MYLSSLFFLGVASKFVGPANKYDVNNNSSSSVAHKYLQVALVADENVAAKHGNHTADFLLVLANIVSSLHSQCRLSIVPALKNTHAQEQNPFDCW